ncbi:hypothetical protein HPB50_014548 [Hyalomma asiaticum]|uniref:Uncharacterized protein n=1 Tax=Hyalomma asiaticum TaxID=266040 RepID=A0ACB7RLC2_HYAAI|nr:hypothetical protein HPB50_014548 [Hyalomma asiaticum]
MRPCESYTEVEIMDTSSSRKRPRPSENTSDDEDSSRKVPAVTQSPESETPPPVEASSVLHNADDSFQKVQSKSQKRVSAPQRQLVPPLVAYLRLAAQTPTLLQQQRHLLLL